MLGPKSNLNTNPYTSARINLSLCFFPREGLVCQKSKLLGSLKQSIFKKITEPSFISSSFHCGEEAFCHKFTAIEMK